MGELSKRAFLVGASGAAIAAMLPAQTPPAIAPIFDGYVGEYNGIVIRESKLTIEMLQRAKAYAMRNVILPEPDGCYRMVVAPSPWSTKRVTKMAGRTISEA